MKKICKYSCFFFATIVLLCSMIGCELPGSKEEQKFSRQIFAMDTIMDLTVYGEQGQEALTQAARLIQRLDNQFSVTNEKSDIAKINAAKGQPVTVAKETYDLVKTSLEYSEQTEGALDISIYPLVKAWGFTQEKQQVPTDKARKAAMKNVNYKNIKCLENSQIQLQPEMEIDLGSIAKGYVSQKIMELWRSMGVTSGIVSLGGNVQTLGKKINGEAYQVGIVNPDNSEQLSGIITVEDKAVVTSGIYQRNFTENNVLYHHIMDASTGMPADNNLASVTVISEDGTKADALATALFVMGEEGIKKYQKNHPEIQVIVIRKDGTFWQSQHVQMTQVNY